MINRIRELILIIAILALSGCKVDEKYQTSHPDKGGIHLTVDWSNAGAEIPQTYQASVISSSGIAEDFPDLSGIANEIVVVPGEAVMYVYNNAQNITILGEKATVASVGSGIAINPGWFFTCSEEINTKRDRDVAITALMNQQTRELKMSLAISPASMISNVKAITAVLDGVASELNMQTNALSGASKLAIAFDKGAYYHTTSMRLLGIVPSAKQNLRLNIEFENGHSTSVVCDLSTLLKNFNFAKNTPLSLVADIQMKEGNNPSVIENHWKVGAGEQYLVVFPTDIELPKTVSDESINIITDRPFWVYSISQVGNWLSVTKTDNQINISASENTGEERQATIQISAARLSEKVTITQAGSNYNYIDKEVVKLQSATVGKGVNIVMMGDGYTSDEMRNGSGKYEKDMRAATEYFFSVYPYTEYRDHFNVYMIAAISNQKGISNKSTNTNLDTKFKAIWDGGNSTGIDCNKNTVFEYVGHVAELSSVNRDDITVIMPINSTVYAGTCLMYSTSSFSDYASGFSICLCPAGNTFKEVVVHESGGHGFAKLCDEYIYYQNESIPANEKNQINSLKSYGWYENIDFYSDITRASWSGFSGNSKYSMVGCFEGGYMYGKGIWRPEHNSCMNDNVFYFNAPSRWAQVRRIKRIAGISYTFAQFMQDDVIPPYLGKTRANYVEKFVPFAPPVVIEKIPDKYLRQ